MDNMNNSMTSSTTGSATEEIAAWVGLDWADKEHKIALYETGSGRVESCSLNHSGEAFEKWLAELKARYNGAKVAVVLEQSRGAVLYALSIGGLRRGSESVGLGRRDSAMVRLLAAALHGVRWPISNLV